MSQAAQQVADEMLASSIAHGRTLIERARLIGDDSDFESWKADQKHWVELTLHALSQIYDVPEPSERFRSAAAVLGRGRAWQLEYGRDAQCVQTAIDVLTSLQRQPEPAQESTISSELAPAFPVGAGLTSAISGSIPDPVVFGGTELAAQPVDPTAPLADAPPAGSTLERTGQIFLVHGRNETYKQAVAGLLDAAGTYEVTILNERPAERRALVEHFEDHTAGSRYAVVLLTADDVGAPRVDSDREPYFSPRARQGVVFELGVLVAVLSPRCICVLYEDGVELPCDLDGVTYVHLDPAGTWRSKLLLQLRAAGFDYDLNSLAPF